jgi:hypothetical protein
MGINAAQLLLSRLDGEVGLRARRVVLPTRLIIRYSCGSKLEGDGGYSPSLPLLADVQSQGILVKPVSPEKANDPYACFDGITLSTPMAEPWLESYDKPDAARLLRVLQHQEADRVPYLEFRVTSEAVYEHVLGRRPGYDEVDTWDARISGLAVAPEDHVEFALRLGMDVVPCDFSWRPNADGRHLGASGDGDARCLRPFWQRVGLCLGQRRRGP